MASARIQPSRLVGRERELSRLGDAVARAVSGAGSLVCVRGATGVGKTRLLAELAGRCRDRGMPVHRAECAHAGRNAALLPGLELLRGLLDVSELEDEHELRRQVAGELTLLDPELHADLPLVFDLLGVPDPERPSGELAPAERRARLASFLRRLLRSPGRADSRLLVVDDVDAIDPLSEVLVRELATAAADSPALLMLACGSDRRPPWIAGAGASWLELAPLSNDATRALVHEILGDDPSVKGLAARVVAASRGRPWLARETLRWLAETGVLSGEPGRFASGDERAGADLPADASALLRERLAQRSPAARSVLEVAAVVGMRIDHALLAEVSPADDDEIRDALEELCGAGILYPSSAEHRFEHPLYRDAAYGEIDPARRAELHADVALAIEETCFERLDALAGLLAHHWAAAGQAASAERWWAHAAWRAGYEGGPPAG